MRLVAGFVSLAVFVSLAANAFAQSADAHEGEILRNAQIVHQFLGSRAARLRTSAGPDPDTVYVGKSYTNHTGPQNY
jgi:hypothetical protein